MSPRQWRFFVEDIIGAGRYSADMDVDAFREDEKTRAAVEREFIVIGEAAGHVPTRIVDKYPSVPWQEMRDMRNFAVHVYWGVAPEVIWDTIKNDLPALTPELHAILKHEPEQA